MSRIDSILKSFNKTITQLDALTKTYKTRIAKNGTKIEKLNTNITRDQSDIERAALISANIKALINPPKPVEVVPNSFVVVEADRPD